MKNRFGILLAVSMVAVSGSCATTPLVSTIGGGASVVAQNAMLPGEKGVAVKGDSPSRELDLADTKTGRQTLVEMYRQRLREIDELKSSVRALEQQQGSLHINNQGLSTQVEELRTELKTEKQERERLQQENQELTARLLEGAVKQAEIERQLLQFKITALKEKRIAMSVPPSSSSSKSNKKEFSGVKPKENVNEHKEEKQEPKHSEESSGEKHKSGEH